MADDQGYAATLEGFVARFDDLAIKLREAANAQDYDEVSDLVDELLEDLERAADFIKKKREERG
jgi:hypothetical protein